MYLSYLKYFTNLHISSNKKPDIFIYSTPRSGSNWLTELICSNSHIKSVNEPFNIRDQKLKKFLKVNNWDDIYFDCDNLIKDHISNYINSKWSYKYKDPRPFSKEHSFFSNRLVYKILHCCENKVDYISEQFNTKTILLFRHPIAVTISRKQLPRLETLLKVVENKLDSVQIESAKRIMEGDDFFLKGILDWILQNTILLNETKTDKFIISYEQLVTDPILVLRELSNFCGDLNIMKMQKRISTPSHTTIYSNDATKHYFKNNNIRESFLIDKWKEKVNEKMIDDTQKLLDLFKMDIYCAKDSKMNIRFQI
jgi:hypothetical protein